MAGESVKEEVEFPREPVAKAKYTTFEAGGRVIYESKLVSYAAHASALENSPLRHDLQTALPADITAYFKLRGHGPTPARSIVQSTEEVPLRFDSQFESGNLRKAVLISEIEYALILHQDTGTSTNTQWFYFAVHNSGCASATFNIINMHKSDLLFTAGLQPAVYSSELFKKNGTGWHHDGQSVTYTPTTVPRFKEFYTLSFKYKFQFANDTVYFAYTVPYSYTQLLEYTDQITVQYESIARVSPLCQTIGGNMCPLITITENIVSLQPSEEESYEWTLSAACRKLLRQKQVPQTESTHFGKLGAVFTARVHSGETVSSHMMKGLLDFLLGDSTEARRLRRMYIFKVVPMLNPDGVRYGNYRTNLIGLDLNRRWLYPNKVLHPTIYYTKRMLEVFNEKYQVVLFTDFHGHSRKKNVFMYGCNRKTRDIIGKRQNLLAKMVPALLAEENKFFSYSDSHFRMERGKEGTARLAIYQQFGIIHSYTMEATSFGASNTPLDEDPHMSVEDFATVGESLAKLCLSFANCKEYLTQFRHAQKLIDKQQTLLSICAPLKQVIPIEDTRPFSFPDILRLEPFWKAINNALIHSESNRLPPLRSQSLGEPTNADSRLSLARVPSKIQQQKVPVKGSYIEIKQSMLCPLITPKRPKTLVERTSDCIGVISSIHHRDFKMNILGNRHLAQNTLSTLEGWSNHHKTRVTRTPMALKSFEFQEKYKRRFQHTLQTVKDRLNS